MIWTVLLVLILIWAVYAYNRFVSLKNLVKEAWSGIDVQLKRRYNLIPNLVETVKSYKNFEKDVLEEITRIRSRCIDASNIKDQSEAENMLSDGFRRFFILAEAYPDLKANASFAALQAQLVEIEDAIQNARRYYNGTVRDYMTFSQTFPANIIFNAFSFGKYEYFQIEPSTAANINVGEQLKGDSK